MRLPQLPPFTLFDEPLLSFSSSDPTAVDVNPLRGLSRIGSFDGASFKLYVPELRIATIGPASGREQLAALLRKLRESHFPTDRREYVPRYPGFEALFGVPLARAVGIHQRWPDNIHDLGQGDSVAKKVTSAMHQSLDKLSMRRDQFDVVAVHLPDAWMPALRTHDFNAHDVLKSIGAKFVIPTQIINDRSFSFKHPASICWRLSIALYAKAGGTPWKLAPLPGAPDHTAYIGLAYAIRRVSDQAHFVTCCSQVFDADGGGMQFVAFEARDPIVNEEEARRNPFLGRTDMRAVLVRSLRLYQDRHGGALPRRLVIHKTTAFKAEELDGVRDAVATIPEVECVEVGSRSTWRGVWMIDSGQEQEPVKATRFPVPRGILQMHSGRSGLLWVAGNAPSASRGGDYFQGGKSIPKPIALTRHMGRGSFDTLAQEALALTKMDWNNDALYDPVPITIKYSQQLARTIANAPDLPGRTYPYRLFM